MDMINIIITNLVSVVLGLGGALLFYRSRSRKEGAEAYRLELDGLKDEITFLNERLEKLREETGKLRDDFVVLKEYSMNLEVELIGAKKYNKLTKSLACHSSECNHRKVDSVGQLMQIIQ